MPPCGTSCADVQPSSPHPLPSKLLELKASGIKDSSGNAISVGNAIDTWLDASGNGYASAVVNSASGIANYASPVLVEHTDSQGSVHKVARFGWSSTWKTTNSLTPMQFLTPAAANNYLYSTQSNGLEVWAVARQPDTGDVSHNTAGLSYLFDVGHLANKGYGLAYAAGRVEGHTSEAHAGSDHVFVATTLTHALTIVRMRQKFGSGGEMRLEKNGQLVNSVSTNLAGLTSSQVLANSNQPTMIGSIAKSYKRNERYFRGELAELTVYDGLLSDDAAAQQLAQLVAKYGITVPSPPPLSSYYPLPSKLLELKASGITGSVGDAISTWSDTSGNSNHASSSGTVAGPYVAKPVLVQHTDSQGSVHKVARFGCSNCASAAPTWGTHTPLQATLCTG